MRFSPPQVRKSTAERAYIGLLTLDDTAFAGDAGDGSSRGVSVETALTVLSETPWDNDAASAAVLAARDRLYALLGCAMPASRSGVDPAVFGTSALTGRGGASGAGAGAGAARSGGAGAGAGAGGGAAGAEEDYGALVREMGY